jgi:hypothetical protein
MCCNAALTWPRTPRAGMTARSPDAPYTGDTCGGLDQNFYGSSLLLPKGKVKHKDRRLGRIQGFSPVRGSHGHHLPLLKNHTATPEPIFRGGRSAPVEDPARRPGVREVF